MLTLTLLFSRNCSTKANLLGSTPHVDVVNNESQLFKKPMGLFIKRP